MFERDFIGNFDISVRGEYLTTFYHVTYGRVLDLVSDFPCDADDIEIRLTEV